MPYQETSDYPTSYDSLIDFEAKKDKVSKAHINRIHNILEAIEAEIGLNPSGNKTTLDDRLSVCIDDDGTLQSGTSFPVSPVARQVFYRTDLETLYIRNHANNAWNALGGSLSNVLLRYDGMVSNAGAHGEIQNTSSLLHTADDAAYRYFKVEGTTYKTLIATKWMKIAGVSTVDIRMLSWINDTASSNKARIKVTIGSVNAEVTQVSSTQTPEWQSGTLDVSSLSNGTVYDVTIEMKETVLTSQAYLGVLLLTGT